MKTDYFQKSSLHEYDNKVPGPGSCKPFIHLDSQLVNQITRRRKHSTTFGNDEKLKLRKESSNIGPAGLYLIFNLATLSPSLGITCSEID
jgi:hypothetical protein